MRHWVHRLGSMKLGIVLLVVVLAAMASGTIVESMHGTETAVRHVYGALWFRALLGALAINIVLALADQFPWGRQKIGFVLTHGSMLVILAGALVTLVFKVEGQLALWEGEESAAFSVEMGGASPAAHPLPFSVQLESFEIDYYQGTRRPAMFRSRVVVDDPSRGVRFPAVIEMNHELSYRGYRLFQSSYQEAHGRDRTILAVSKDPGQPIVFLGYGALVLGMTTVLLTRIVQRRAASRLHEGSAARIARPVAAALVTLFAILAPRALLAGAPSPHSRGMGLGDPTVIEALRRLPVQHDGRVMPFDTLAREGVLRVTGESRWQGMEPVAVALGWAVDPHAALAPVVRIGGRELGAHLGLPEGATHASFAELVDNHHLHEVLGEARAAQEAERPLHGLLADASKLEERLIWMQGFLDGSALRAVPGIDAGAAWRPVDEAHSLDALLAVHRTPPGAAFYPSARTIDREILYNRARPARLSWWILLGATAASLAGWVLRRRWLEALALAGLALGFAVMTGGIALRWQIAGRIPASNMYESMLFLGWGAGLFALVAFVVFRNRLVILNATAMSALAMMLADLLPIDGFIHPVPPVLAGTAWLAIHVPIIMVSYSVLALGVLIAHMQVGLEIFAPSKRQLSSRMSDLLYWYLHVGSILLITGIMTGSIWAASSWGRYWGWDPKEVWSLVAFLAYMGILHGRLDKPLGPLGVAAASIVAFLTILMTYVGVNFVLTSGLHSYGFGSSRVVTWLALVALAEILFIGAGFATRSWRVGPHRSRGAVSPA